LAVNAATVAQGTVGIAATFLSALLVAVGLLQVAKGNSIIRIENRRDRALAKIDQLLKHRHLAIIDGSDSTSLEAASEAHARSYWSRLNAYAKLRQGDDVDKLQANLISMFKPILSCDPYVAYVSQIFDEADLLSDLGVELAQEGVDHVWTSLTNEERILFLIALLIDVGRAKLPSESNIRLWEAAAGKSLPWGSSEISLQDVYHNARRRILAQEPQPETILRLWNRNRGTPIR
jgi:hypothetical protein